ncbi:hypothetical protein KDA14_04045 [Candidatus Saccharibacteria bacterium]|nr:hypothetical protein [Candidatus Saccharibacteria bacterium]
MEEEKTQAELSKLDALHKRATSVLFRCSTMFPFDLFPNTLLIDHNKVDIIYRTFFGNSHTVSIPIAQLNYVGVESVFFLATLKLETIGLEQNPAPLAMLGTRDAEMAKNILFGLMAAEKHDIDLSAIPDEQMLAKVIEIGRAAG